MIINEDSKFISFTPKELSSSEIKKLYIPRGLEEIIDSITEVDGKYYYYKGVDFEELLNELIGSYYSKLIRLDAVDYQIGIYNHELYALSQIFFDSRFEYYNCDDYLGTIADHKLTESESLLSRFYLKDDKILRLIDNPRMLLNILKLSIVDIKMGQIDRNNLGNVMIKKAKSNGVVDLAPIIDFGCSYDDSPPYPEFYFYDNPFLVLRKNILSLSLLTRKYPQILNSMKTLAALKMEDALQQIQAEKRIILSVSESKYYIEKDREYSKVLQKVI